MDAQDVILYSLLALLVIGGLVAGIQGAQGSDWYRRIKNNPSEYRGQQVQNQGLIVQQVGDNKYLLQQESDGIFHVTLIGSAAYVDIRQDNVVRYAGVLDGIYTYKNAKGKDVRVPI